MSTPELPDAPWQRFRADPRSNGDLRAGDPDREVAQQILAEAYADGQLDRTEYDQRLGGVMTATHLGNLVPAVGDLSVGPAPRPSSTPDSHRSRPRRRSALALTGANWLFVTIIVNVVWLATAVGRGHAYYYWPIWPMFGMAIPVLAVLLFGNRHRDDRPELPRADEARGQREIG